MCFEFCSKSYLGTHTIEQRRDYTQQIFDFYNKNFPGISIYKDQNFKTPPLKFRVPYESFIMESQMTRNRQNGEFRLLGSPPHV